MRYIISFALSILPLAIAPLTIAPLAAQAEVPRVAVDIPPIYGLVASVMGDLGQPVLLLDKGAGAHDFQLRPSQMRDIAAADLVVWIGPKMTPWLERALGGAGGQAQQLALLDLPQTLRMDFAQAKDDGDHGHEAHGHEAHGHNDHPQESKGKDADGQTHDDDHAHEEDGHGHTGTDPHAWLDPGNAAPWLDAIAAALSQRDPGNAVTYAANAAAAKAEIAALDAELAALLAPVADKGFVTYHDAYGYFAAHYGLAYWGAVALGDGTTAGAAHLRGVQDQIAQGVVCVFPEGQHDSQTLLQLIDSTPVKAGAALDPEGAMLDAARSSYGDVLRNLAVALAGCLGGA